MKAFREIGFVLVLAAVCTLVMSGGEVMLRPPPGVSAEFMMRALALAGVSVDMASASDRLAATFQASFAPVPSRTDGVYRARRRPWLLLCEQEGNGMWGRIRLFVAYDAEAGRLEDLGVIAQSETPGLGTRIAEPEFENRFDGLAASAGLRLATGTPRPDTGEVQAITGATISCAAVVKIADEALKRLRK
ncbi:MAG TPA: FMN-binding protein [Candidatus Ozemobacteraceae bacterium]|nr:FMN-binding protein [Candidatus Ozemobacteraceae bacterium]